MAWFKWIIDMLKIWKGFWFSPQKTIETEIAKKAGLWDGVKHLFLSSVLLAFFGTILFFLLKGVFDELSPMLAGQFLFLFFISFIPALIGVFLILLTSMLLANSLYRIGAFFLGGKGRFAQQFYLISAQTSFGPGNFWTSLLPYSAIAVALGINDSSRGLGPGFWLMATVFITTVVLALYDVYIKTRILSKVHLFSMIRALLCLIIGTVPLVLIGFYVTILYVLVMYQVGGI